MPIRSKKFISLGRFLDELISGPDGFNSTTPPTDWMHDRVPASSQLLRAFKPLIKMKNDAIKSFKPFEYPKQAGKDALQPLRGLSNLALGLLTLIAAPIILVVSLFALPFLPKKGKIFYPFVLPLSYLINGVSNVVRGVTQMVTSPLTWMFKLPLRALLTRRHDYLPVKDDPEFQKRLIAYQNRIVPDSQPISRLHNFLSKAEEKGREMPLGYAGNLKDWQLFENLYANLPESIRPFMMVERYKSLQGKSRSKFLGELKTACESKGEDGYDKNVVNALQRFGLYNNVKLFLMVCQKLPEVGIEPPCKDIVKIMGQKNKYLRTIPYDYQHRK